MIKALPNCCVVVVSRGRSGTSMIAGVLQHLGVCMGEKLLPANHNNPLGFYEDSEFNEIHKKVCGDWKCPKPSFSGLRDEYKRIVEKKDQQKLWGLKDPLLCFVLDEFAKNLTKSEMKIIDINRDINESIASLMNRDLYWNNSKSMMSYDQAKSICESYDSSKEMCLRKLHNTQILRLDHRNVINNPEEAVRQIADFVGVAVKKEAIEFIKPHLVNRRKCLFRWTVGPIKEEGIKCLFQSVKSVRRLYPEAELLICHNQISEQRISQLSDLKIELVDQSKIHSELIQEIPEGYRFDWKLVPTRLRPNKHEIFIDNDIVILKRVPEIDLFLNRDDLVLICQGLNGCHGIFESKVGKGLRVNAGMFGLHPNFDFGSKLKNIMNGQTLDGHFDEQGLIAATLSKEKHVMLSQTTIPILERDFDIDSFMLNETVCGFHFVGVNYCDDHTPWFIFKDSLKHKHL